MPTSRWFVKRDLNQALVHLARIQDYLTRSGALYAADYPQQYEMFCVLIAFVDQLEQGIKELKSHI